MSLSQAKKIILQNNFLFTLINIYTTISTSYPQNVYNSWITVDNYACFPLLYSKTAYFRHVLCGKSIHISYL